MIYRILEINGKYCIQRSIFGIFMKEYLDINSGNRYWWSKSTSIQSGYLCYIEDYEKVKEIYDLLMLK